jgi:hypothetical protein
MNLIEEYKKGQSGANRGLSMGPGLMNVSNAINGVQRSRIYGLAAKSKAGKSTFADYGFVINPILDAYKKDIPIEVIYFSFELDRVSKEFDFLAYFLYLDKGIETIKLDEGIFKDGKNVVSLTPDYLRGRLQDDNGNTIKVKDSVFEAIKELYQNRIIPFFGEFDEKGIRIKKGYITFVDQKDNPTGLYKYLKRHAMKYGNFLTIPTVDKKERIIGYKPNNPNKYTIVITDHLRKLLPERGFTLKQTVDKYIEYQVELRNWCGFTFVDIIHTNRSMADQDRLRFAKDMLYPTSDDIKDTGNLSEDADFVFTMMNPNDDIYNLKKHFGLDIKDSKDNLIYPGLRTIHLVESRHCEFPQHFRTNMMGGLKSFKPFKQ